jgi:hypothetical protein
VPQKDKLEPARKENIRLELLKVLSSRYFEYGDVMSLTQFFAVAKGDEDIRMVCNSISSGLNAHLWCPWFALDTIDIMLRALEPGTYMGNIDVGEMFLNFILEARCSYLAGVDLSKYIDQLGGEPRHWVRWGRCRMRFRPSPYQTTQSVGWAKEVILGDRLDARNVFKWAAVRMNFPGSSNYNPRVQWVSKVWKEDGRVTADLFIYIDDFRRMMSYEEECRRVAWTARIMLNYLGLQEAPRKYHPGSMTPGSWAESMSYTIEGEVRLLIARKKWDKGKGMILDPMRQRKESRWLDHKELEQGRGFLIYLSRKYPL